jgi:protein-L-isoaspartate O-methyltransferase
MREVHTRTRPSELQLPFEKSLSLIPSGSRRIGHGATISAPHMHAHASEYLLNYLEPGSKVLDVGSGSGYLTAIFHHLVSPGNGQPIGKVVGIDHITELVDWSVENLKRDGLSSALESGQIEMVAGDGREGELPTYFCGFEIPPYLYLQAMQLLGLTTVFMSEQLPLRYHRN